MLFYLSLNFTCAVTIISSLFLFLGLKDDKYTEGELPYDEPTLGWNDLKNCTSSSSFSVPSSAIRNARRSLDVEFWLNIPAWMTFSSTLSLYLAAARIFSSTLLTVISLSTRTSFFCPIRWARSWAWRSYKYQKNIQLINSKNRPSSDEDLFMSQT